ncbi:MAG TPA: G1 family glutamic endopeptidase [Streptosporangiaceae bacterium]|nr:G1 family glutamic endopeptidase [Streptosporangiaceae bacterium]
MTRKWCTSLAGLTLAAGLAATAPALAATTGHQAAPRATAAHTPRLGGPLRLVPGTHPIRTGHRRFAVGSPNWSGYAVSGGKFKKVSASWTLNAVTCPSGSADAAPWVGIDGFNDKTVEQTGSDSICSSGKPKYVAWYEMFPAPPVFLAKTVKPGDHFTGTVTHTTGTSYTLTLADTTQGWTNTVHKSLSAKNASAEAVLELAFPKLANFGTDKFTAVTVDSKPIGSYTTAPFTLTQMFIQVGGTKCDATSALSNKDAFSETWKATC